MNKETILGIVRHVLTFVGGIVVAKGLLDEGIVTAVIGGALTVVGAVWSIVDKIKGKKSWLKEKRKVAKAVSNSNKVTFGKRKGGKAKKRKSPRDKSVSKPRGQGNV